MILIVLLWGGVSGWLAYRVWTPVNIADMSDVQLIGYTKQTAKRLRDFDEWERNALQPPFTSTELTDHFQEARVKFKPIIEDAQLLNLELCHRLRRPTLGVADLTRGTHPTLLDIGATAVLEAQEPVGSEPGATVAEYLEELASQLRSNQL